MLNNILFKALLKISKENKENNYIYSDINYPKTFLKEKTRKEMRKQLFYKTKFNLEQIYTSKKSKTTKMKDSKDILKNAKKQRNKYNSNLVKKLSSFSKTDLINFCSLPKVSCQKNNNVYINDLREKFSIRNIDLKKLNSLQLTPRKQKSFLFDEYTKKLKAIRNKNIDLNSSNNFQIVKINSPKEQIQKSISNISSNFYDIKNLGETSYKKRFYKIIRLKACDNKLTPIQKKDLNEDEKNSKTVKDNLMYKIGLKLKSDLAKKEFNFKKMEKTSLSLSCPKKRNKSNLEPKLYPMIQINNFREKYISIKDIDNIINKTKEELNLILYKSVPYSNNNDIYYYTINKMYSNQIKEYMKHRINWEFISDKNLEKNITINFSWRYFSNRVNYKKYKYNPESFKSNCFSVKKLRMVNLFERNYEVGNKKYMFNNLINYCDKINMNVFDIVPFTVIINNSPEVELGLESLKEIVYFVNKNKSNDLNIISNRKYSEHFWFDKNYKNVNKQYININKNFLSEKNYWIIKPTDLYQGKCVEIFSDFNQIYKQCKNIFRGVNTKILPEYITKEEDNIDNCFNNYNENETANNIMCNLDNELNSNNTINKKKTFYSKMYCSNEIIIQKYLDKPLLYNNRKFDIRCFVLVDYNLNLFFFREGHLKACSELYNLNDRNIFIHITNYSLQKKSLKFETYEEGNEISYYDFKKFLVSQNISLINFDNMISQMKLLVEISMKAVGKKLLRTNPVLSFEIFGYDFIIDNEFKPWILEINNNPGLVISSPVIQKIIPRMLDDAFRLTIDKIFETKYDLSCNDNDWKYKSKFPIDGFTDEENIFEFLCNIK